MNVYDSEHMIHQLASIGYYSTDVVEDADLIILNTCSVREKPVQKVLSKLGRLRSLKESRPDLLMAVAGCVAQQEQEALAKRIPDLDLVFGPDQIPELPHLIETRLRSGKQVVATRFVEDRDALFPTLQPAASSARVSAFVTIIKGCNQFCSYCIVPHTRGREVSKPPQKILAEIRSLLATGVKEIFLLGQNVNRYGLDHPDYPSFTDLLELVHDLPGLLRLRFITSHPADCHPKLVDAFGRLPRLTPFFHLPLQSGSDRILALMNRKYDFAHYREQVRQLRQIIPSIHISTDIIVGFPDETDDDFNLTLAAAEEIRWGSSFSFQYSPRPGTPAADMRDDIPAPVKQARLAKLQKILYDTMAEAMQRLVGRTEEVLIEGFSNRPPEDPGMAQVTGRTGSNYIVNVSVPAAQVPPAGSLVAVTIQAALAHSLLGEMLPQGEQNDY